MTIKPENCAACGKPTRSHNIAIDVSEHDDIGLPTLAGVCCHLCWTGETDEETDAIESMLDDPDALRRAVDIDRMVSAAIPVEELLG